jgi:hypothetical protein
MLNMDLQEYIQAVLAANSLRDVALYLLETGDAAYHSDRHVDEPPQGLGAEAACFAGLALLREWARDAESLSPIGLVSSKPLLVIDQEWLNDLPDAPPPHVLVTIAKSSSDLPSEEVNAKQSTKADCPLGKLLSDELEDVTVFKVEASAERESLGGWLFRLDNKRK